MYLIYEQCLGDSMEDRLDAKSKVGGMTSAECIGILELISSALAFMHSLDPPILHGALADTRLICSTVEGEWKLCGFPAARVVKTDELGHDLWGVAELLHNMMFNAPLPDDLSHHQGPITASHWPAGHSPSLLSTLAECVQPQFADRPSMAALHSRCKNMKKAQIGVGLTSSSPDPNAEDVTADDTEEADDAEEAAGGTDGGQVAAIKPEAYGQSQQGVTEEQMPGIAKFAQTPSPDLVSPQPVVAGSPTAEELCKDEILTVTLRRGPSGLGLGVDDANAIARLVPDGQAAKDGVVRVGDVIKAIDGEPLRGRKMAQVMAQGRNSYQLTIQRATKGRSSAQSMNDANEFEQEITELILEATCSCGSNGLGFGIDDSNIVVSLVPLGAAAADGLLTPGDEVISVDGEVLNGRKMAKVLIRGRKTYQITIRRRNAMLVSSVARLKPKTADGVADAHPVWLRAIRTQASRLLHRHVKLGDCRSLGLDVDNKNVIRDLLPHGAVVRSGVEMLPGDVVVAVNGIELGVRRIKDVMPRHRPSYDFLLLRDPDKATGASASVIEAAGEGKTEAIDEADSSVEDPIQSDLLSDSTVQEAIAKAVAVKQRRAGICDSANDIKMHEKESAMGGADMSADDAQGTSPTEELSTAEADVKDEYVKTLLLVRHASDVSTFMAHAAEALVDEEESRAADEAAKIEYVKTMMLVRQASKSSMLMAEAAQEALDQSSHAAEALAADTAAAIIGKGLQLAAERSAARAAAEKAAAEQAAAEQAASERAAGERAAAEQAVAEQAAAAEASTEQTAAKQAAAEQAAAERAAAEHAEADQASAEQAERMEHGSEHAEPPTTASTTADPIVPTDTELLMFLLEHCGMCRQELLDKFTALDRNTSPPGACGVRVGPSYQASLPVPGTSISEDRGEQLMDHDEVAIEMGAGGIADDEIYGQHAALMALMNPDTSPIEDAAPTDDAASTILLPPTTAPDVPAERQAASPPLPPRSAPPAAAKQKSGSSKSDKRKGRKGR